MASQSSSPCAGCKFLRRKCQPNCIFAPYFPPDQPQKFQNVHRIFGASNVAKMLGELHPSQREDAVNSLAYEADMRLRDPVYGCVSVISVLNQQLNKLQSDLAIAKSELYRCQSLGLTSQGLLAAANAAASNHHHHHQQGIDFIGSTSGGGRNQLYQHNLQYFPMEQQQQQQHVMRTFDGGSNYDESNLAAMKGGNWSNQPVSLS